MKVNSKLIAILLLALVSCSSIGYRFRSDLTTLQQLQVGKTSPEQATDILGGKPHIRQNIADGTIVWHWQSIVSGAYVGVTDNKLLALQFDREDSESEWRLLRVLHAQNIELPPEMPFGSVSN